jgi:hypothetical protein
MQIREYDRVDEKQLIRQSHPLVLLYEQDLQNNLGHARTLQVSNSGSLAIFAAVALTCRR